MMTSSRRKSPAPLLAAAGFLCALVASAGCSAGGGESSGGGPFATTDDFAVVSVNVQPNQEWQINRPIEVAFSRDVDFSTVSLNTINISRSDGAPALGSFFLRSPRRVVFQPKCPTKDDFSDAGFKPGGQVYHLFIPTGNNGGVSVKSTAGKPLESGRSLFFRTPVSTLAGELFLDPIAGPPSPKIWNPATQTVAQQAGHSYVQVGGDPNDRVYFELDSGSGTGSLPMGFELPLNLYSEAASRVTVFVEIDQPVNPSTANISSERLRLEYQELNGAWREIPTTVELVANCVASGTTEAGARLRLRPESILPQGRAMRVNLLGEFEDLVGERNGIALTSFATMVSTVPVDPGTANPGDSADEFLEEFTSSAAQSASSLEDAEALFDVPPARWRDDFLEAGFEFEGTGGPGGTFDLHLGSGQNLTINTDSGTTVSGGPGGLPTSVLLILDGFVNVRDLFIPDGATLRVEGSRPVEIWASRDVIIEGQLVCRGSSNLGVGTLNTNFQPEQGSPGQGGGGRGGVGSPNTTSASPKGADGFGAFNSPGGGGVGGDSAFNTGGVDLRRPGGGGGGVLGADVLTVAAGLPETCPNQNVIGLDAEDGFNGSPEAQSAITGQSPPRGGSKGPGPFSDGDPTNDFWGRMVRNFQDPDPANRALVQGELLNPSAGAGGGGGGDAYASDVFPTNPYNPFGDDKGSGGGGGGGSVAIYALGRIQFGPNGEIHVDGGTGGGGENTGGVNRVGGGSGGGSGGHLILQSATVIDLSQMTNVNVTTPKITARGGQGGAGRNESGGAHAGGEETTPGRDGVHAAVDGCFTGQGNPPVDPLNAGGDGGPGVIQFHVPDPRTDVLGPFNSSPTSFRNAVNPSPVGYDRTVISSLADAWKDQMLPIFGRFSRARSRWIPLGAVHTQPATQVPEEITFLFEGTNPATGRILRSGLSVEELPALVGPTALVAAPGVPSFDASTRQLTVSAAGLVGADDVYKRTPSLLRRYEVQADDGQVTSFEVASATYDAGANVLLLTIAGDGATPAAVLVPGTQITLLPHFFRVRTSGVVDSLPPSSEVTIEFQATSLDGSGEPDLGAIFPAPETWSTDVDELNAAMENSAFRFYRFRVSFDILATGGELGFNTPRPSLDFLRLPFRF